jgi:hypothetical protein
VTDSDGRGTAPTIDDLVRMLEATTDLKGLDPTARLLDLGVASFDFMQWMFEVDEAVGVDLGEEIEMERLGELTMVDLHAALVGALARPAAGPT